MASNEISILDFLIIWDEIEDKGFAENHVSPQEGAIKNQSPIFSDRQFSTKTLENVLLRSQ